MKLFTISPFEIPELDPDYSDQEVFFVGRGAAYFRKHSLVSKLFRAWITVVHGHESGCFLTGKYSGETWFDEWFDFDCDEPHPEHWLAHEIDGVGLDEIIMNSFTTRQTESMEWMMENGIAPGQRFMTEVHYRVSKDYWTGEVDALTEARVMWIEPWPEEKVIEAWSNYLKASGWDQNISIIDSTQRKEK